MLHDLLQNVQLNALWVKAKQDSNKSKIWSSAYKWFLNPLIMCPYCGEWLETRRVWVVDGDRNKVVKLYTLNGFSISVECCHPHVGGAGAICMGTATTVTQALFSSLSEDAYTRPDQWLSDILRHECEEMGNVKEEDDYITCHGCGYEVRDDDHCYSEYDNCRYCYDCYYAVHWSCYPCGEHFHINSDETRHEVEYEDYCEYCFARRYFKCLECEESFPHADSNRSGYCEECFDTLYEHCRDCGEMSLISDGAFNSEGLCEECEEKQQQGESNE